MLRVHVAAPSGSVLGLRAYVWGGRLVGWKRIRTGVTVSGGTTLTWDGTTSTGHALADGTLRRHRLLGASGAAAPRGGGAAAGAGGGERPPPAVAPVGLPARAARRSASSGWRRSSTRREASTGRATLPLVVSADRGRATRSSSGTAVAAQGTTAGGSAPVCGARPGLYHVVARDPAGDEFRAPVVVRDSPPARPPAAAHRARRLALPDLARVQRLRRRPERDPGQLVPVLAPAPRLAPRGDRARGVEDDYKAARPFSRWLCSRSVRTQHVTDVELGRLPLSMLRRYPAIVFPGHSEYYEPHDLGAADATTATRAGNLVFLQANPFYRQVRLVQDRNAMVMTDFDARDRGTPTSRSPGVGYDGCCFPKSRAARYVAATGARLHARALALPRDRDRARRGVRLRGLRERPDRPRAVAARPRRRGRGDHPRQLRRRERGARLVAGGARRGRSRPATTASCECRGR